MAASQKYDIVNRAAIRVKELDDFPFIALSEVHCLGEQVQSFCYQQDVNLNIVSHTAQLSTVQIASLWVWESHWSHKPWQQMLP